MSAPQIVSATDDVGPYTGPVYYGDYTNDNAPVVRISLGDQAAAGQTLQLSDAGRALAAVTLSAVQVQQGYAEVPVSGLGEGWRLLTATLQGADGASVASSPQFALGVATAKPVAPVIVSADDNVGAATGAVHDGGRTDDATPTLHITEAGLPPLPSGSPGHAPYGGPALMSGHVQLYENGQLIGDATLGYGGEVTITPGALSAGEHVLTAVAVDRAGNVSDPSAAFRLTIGADPVVSASPAPTKHGDRLVADAAHRDLLAGAGDDTVTGTDVAADIRGAQGDDVIIGGSAANQINGNTGADTIYGNSRVGDLLMGGQGDDLIDARGSTGHDSVNGNVGDDVIFGGAGGSYLWGGQGDDLIIGGAGADWISGDKGNNTVTGGAGADIFHGLSSGTTRVTDFSLAQGDRVQIDAGVSYQVSQDGGNTVIDLSGGGHVVLVGVQSSSLTGGWIFQS